MLALCSELRHGDVWIVSYECQIGMGRLLMLQVRITVIRGMAATRESQSAPGGAIRSVAYWFPKDPLRSLAPRWLIVTSAGSDRPHPAGFREPGDSWHTCSRLPRLSRRDPDSTSRLPGRLRCPSADGLQPIARPRSLHRADLNAGFG